MTNSRATKGMQLIESYEASGTSAEKVFTILPVIDWDKVAYLILEFDVTATATFNLELIINDETAAYYKEGMNVAAGTMTAIDDSNLAHVVLASTNIISAANHGGAGQIRIYNKSSGTFNYAFFQGEASSSVAIFETYGAAMTADITTITSITVTTSTSTWKAGTRMSLYKVLR